MHVLAINVFVLVISHYKGDIVVITRNRGGAEVEYNNNNIVRIMGYNWLLSQIR